MSILSDNQIKALCVPPETFFDNEKYLSWVKEPHVTLAPLNGPDSTKAYWEEVKKTFERPATQEEKDAFVPMISPYVGDSIRELTNEFSGDKDKYKILSYGQSSYGYDVRLDYQFKIFTNVNGSEIDPRNISEDCLVDGVMKHTQDGASYVILPPNSYLLGVTMEYFVMPRDVMAIALGKSTLARCFTGDTQIALINGGSISFVDMIKGASRGETYWGYSVNGSGRVVEAELTQPRLIGHEKIIEITLDNKKTIRCTPDHKFLTRSGAYKQAKDLIENESMLYGTGDERRRLVTSVHDLDQTEDVYCLTAPDHGNFALMSGVIAKNCGAILNVTPIEPGFRGNVVVEIANATSLPMRIYANQGIGQLVFFQGTEACRVSYGDRSGRYQGQTGIQLAKP